MDQRRRKLKTKMMRVIRRWIAIACFIMILTPTVSSAENRSAKDYMEEGIRSAYHNMNLIYEAYYDDDGNLEVQPAGHVAIEQEWDGDQLISRTYLDEDGQPINRVDGYAKAIWSQNENGVWSVSFYGADDNTVSSEGLNLIRNAKLGNGEWSEWMTPDPNQEYSLFTIDEIILDDKETGDYYTCQIEIEFSGVKAKTDGKFGIWTQGTTDGGWEIGNIWWRGVWLEEPPPDGIFPYVFTRRIDANMTRGSIIDIGFRCDQWASGSFRVRGLKIEKGDTPSYWTPGI